MRRILLLSFAALLAASAAEARGHTGGPDALEFSPASEIMAGEEAAFTVRASHSDSQMCASSLLVHWGDGQSTAFHANQDSCGRWMRFTDVVHTYEQPGSYEIQATARHGGHHEAHASIQVEVGGNVAPEISAQNASGPEDAAIQMQTSIQDDAGVIHVFIDWGDGSNESFSTTSGDHNFSHVYADPGQYNVSMTATDAEGAQSSTAAIIDVWNVIDSKEEAKQAMTEAKLAYKDEKNAMNAAGTEKDDRKDARDLYKDLKKGLKQLMKQF